MKATFGSAAPRDWFNSVTTKLFRLVYRTAIKSWCCSREQTPRSRSEPLIANRYCRFAETVCWLNEWVNRHPASFATQTVMSGGAALTESGFRAAQTLSTFLCPKPLNRRTGHTRSSRVEKMVGCGSDSEILERFT